MKSLEKLCYVIGIAVAVGLVAANFITRPLADEYGATPCTHRPVNANCSTVHEIVTNDNGVEIQVAIQPNCSGSYTLDQPGIANARRIAEHWSCEEPADDCVSSQKKYDHDTTCE